MGYWCIYIGYNVFNDAQVLLFDEAGWAATKLLWLLGDLNLSKIKPMTVSETVNTSCLHQIDFVLCNMHFASPIQCCAKTSNGGVINANSKCQLSEESATVIQNRWRSW